jgi:hypothetical protein
MRRSSDAVYFLIRILIFRMKMLHLSSALKSEASGFSETALEDRVLMTL